MKLIDVVVDELKPIEKNVRRHTEIQIDEFAKSLKQFGQTRPFVIDESNTILVGNGMFYAMQKAGIKEASAYRMKGLSDMQKKKLMLTDNKIYSLASDNFDVIEELLKEFAKAGDFEIPGFDATIVESLAKEQSQIIAEGAEYGKMKVEEPVNQAVQNNAEYRPDSEAQSAAIDREYSSPAETIKTVMCPNCGEVIRL